MRFLSVWLLAACSWGQPVFTDVFPSSEFAARRARVMERIGDGVVILQGTTERPGEQPLRQGDQFFYLCGAVEPRAILVIDGKNRRSALFLNPLDERRAKLMFGPGLYPGPDAERLTRIESVLPRDQLKDVLAAFAGRTLYTPFRPEVLGSASAGDVSALARATKDDPWDGRPSREEAFIARLKLAVPNAEIRDLDPIIDDLRAFKSAREIAILREATRIAGLGIMEAMRDARPGMYEYELQADAEFVFKKNGAYGPAYFALIATGENTFYSHYHKGTAKLENGDLVQFDYAPDYRYYASDVTRVFPANGKFTARQREFYGIYLDLYRALMASIRVHATAAEIVKDAVAKMDGIMASFHFTDARIKAAATRFVEGYRTRKATSLGHSVGMSVHDVRNPGDTLEPGEVFTIEPAMQIPEEHVGIRLEDMILMTQTGYENLSAFVPIEIGDIERLMAAHHGLSDGLSDVQIKLPKAK